MMRARMRRRRLSLRKKKRTSSTASRGSWQRSTLRRLKLGNDFSLSKLILGKPQKNKKTAVSLRGGIKAVPLREKIYGQGSNCH